MAMLILLIHMSIKLSEPLNAYWQNCLAL